MILNLRSNVTEALEVHRWCETIECETSRSVSVCVLHTLALCGFGYMHMHMCLHTHSHKSADYCYFGFTRKTEIASLFKVEVTSGLLQCLPLSWEQLTEDREKNTNEEKRRIVSTTQWAQYPTSHAALWDVVLSLSFSLSPSGFLGQWDDMLKVGLHLASYLNRAATSQEHGSLPDCRLIKELLGWPSVPVGGQGSGLSLALPHSHCEALKRRIATETPLRPHNTTYFPPKQKMPLMGFLFPSLPLSPPPPFQTSVNYLAFWISI